MFYRFNHGLQWRNALHTPLAVLSCAMSLSGLIGCAASPTALDQHFGQSSRQAIVLQTLDTQAYARANLHQVPMGTPPVWWSSAITNRLNSRPSPFES
jgi:hypothetical protein